MTARAPSITDTIVAVATGWRRTPRAVIRVSGPGTRALCQTLFEAVPGAGGHIVPTRFRLTDTLTLPCLLIRYDGPRSYTGEDGAEMIVPGNPILLERIAARLVAEPGVREATPGEFSARAYLAGRLTLAQAEGVAALIGAENDAQLGAAAALMSGRSGERHRRWADEVAGVLALVEAGIDFTDQEDVVPIAPARLAARIGAVVAEIESDLGAAVGRERATGLPRVVLVGAPNAGKSTLFNALLGRGRAMVSPVAGTTRDALVEELDLRAAGAPGTTVELVDLAGLEPVAHALPEIDAEAQHQARAELDRADVLVLCDPRGRFDALDAIATNKPTIRVRTKADLLGHGADGGVGESGGGVIGVCSLDGWNLDTLRRAIADAATGAGHAGGVWLLPRHRRTLAAADGALRAAIETIDPTAPALKAPELVAGALRSALDQLGELVGDISPDDVIGRVFATFCVGK